MTARILNHGLSSFGSYCGLNYAYAYIKNIVTYTAADFIHDNLGSIAGATGVILFVLVIVFARHDHERKQNRRKSWKKPLKRPERPAWREWYFCGICLMISVHR